MMRNMITDGKFFITGAESVEFFSVSTDRAFNCLYFFIYLADNALL
jgi:hypothetical protein